MRRLLTVGLVLVVMVAFVAFTAPAQETKEAPKAAAPEVSKEKPKHEYVGAAKCKGCHLPQYTSWLETKHAKAFDALSAEDKKKAECVVCHVTGKMADGTVINGVECEACHGPGSDYKSMKIMNKTKWAADPAGYKKMAVDAGLVYPKEEDCMRCHKKDGNPNFKPLDFATARTKVHKMSAAAPAAPK
jgi:hypothetical protein